MSLKYLPLVFTGTVPTGEGAFNNANPMYSSITLYVPVAVVSYDVVLGAIGINQEIQFEAEETEIMIVRRQTFEYLKESSLADLLVYDQN